MLHTQTHTQKLLLGKKTWVFKERVRREKRQDVRVRDDPDVIRGGRTRIVPFFMPES